MPRLVEADWQVPLGVHDAIQSLLVDHPETYYMATSRQWLWYLTREHGLLLLENDFSNMSDEEVDAYIVGVLELLG